MADTVNQTLNPFDPMWRTDPYPLYAHLNTLDDAVLLDEGFWVVTRHSAVGSILRDAGNFSSQHRVMRRPEMMAKAGSTLRGFKDMLAQQDPPEHTQLRMLMNVAFSPKRVAGMEVVIRQIVNELLDQLIPNGCMDFSKDFAYMVPLIVITRLLGVPSEDMLLFRDWGDAFALAQGRKPSKEALANSDRAMDECLAYFGKLADERRRVPQDDLITAFVQAEVDGEKLTDRQIQVNCMLVVTAGHESTANMLANGLHAFFTYPEEWRKLLGNPELAVGAIEEILRYDGPIQMVTRLVNDDIDFNGHKMSKDQSVVLLLAAANRDPDAFPNPDSFDIERKGSVAKHDAFGSGRHTCFGAGLARMEGRIVMRALIDRLADLRPDGEPVRLITETVRGFSSFPIRF